MITRPSRVGGARTPARAARRPRRGGSGCSGRGAGDAIRRAAGRARGSAAPASSSAPRSARASAGSWVAPWPAAQAGQSAPPSRVLKARPPSRGSGVPSRTQASSAGAKPSALTSCQSTRKPSASSSDRGATSRQAQRVAQQVVALGMGIGGREAQHDLGERGGGGVALEVGREPDVQPEQIEAGQDVELAVLLHQQPGLALAQDLERGAEPAPGAQRALGDRALDPVLPRGQPHDLGGLAVPERGEHDRRRSRVCGMQERYGPRSEAAARLLPIRTTSARRAQRPSGMRPDLLQLLVEHVRDARRRPARTRPASMA